MKKKVFEEPAQCVREVAGYLASYKSDLSVGCWGALVVLDTLLVGSHGVDGEQLQRPFNALSRSGTGAVLVNRCLPGKTLGSG